MRLAKQPVQILGILVNRPGGVVSREELRKQLWGSDTIVDFEHGLNTAINKLRQALDDSAERPRYIETLPGRGYRFLATVQPEGSVDYSSELPAAPQTPRVRVWVLPVAICIGAIFGIVATMGLLLIRRATEIPKATAVKFAISAPAG
ncbi:MAG TPA: helix-turn-helix domain-containing protein, partial [Terriglobales bacterium]|nr:helix-turn-helix domain-containing protein [Terriglobales bacterium]